MPNVGTNLTYWERSGLKRARRSWFFGRHRLKLMTNHESFLGLYDLGMVDSDRYLTREGVQMRNELLARTHG